MTRRKVKLTYITNDSKRKSTFKKRRSGLIKKIEEISTLCGIEACAIIFGENDAQPEVWPSPCGVQTVLSRFGRMPEVEQSKKMVNQESFLKQRILKTQEQVKKQRKENKKKEMINLMFQCLNAGRVIDNVSMTGLNDLSWFIDQKLKEVEQNIDRLSNVEMAGNGVEFVSGGEHAHVHHAQGLETNINVMQNQPLTMNFSNNFGHFTNNVGHVPSFGEVDIPSLY